MVFKVKKDVNEVWSKLFVDGLRYLGVVQEKWEFREERLEQGLRDFDGQVCQGLLFFYIGEVRVSQ